MLGIRLKTLSQITGLALAGLLTVVPQASQAESLGDALVGAYRNSALLEQNRALLRAADEGVAFEVGKLRPVLSYALSQSRSDTALGVSNSTTASLSASMLLWDFGRTQLGVEAQKETVLATRQALIDIEQ
ncbi:MAG: outer membrane protein, partial [Dinoroseobacter sp.]